MRFTPILALVLVSRAAVAQTPAGDVGSAAAAFQEGQRAQLARDFSRAAEFFEIADHAAPSAAALRSAIRSHQAAGHAARAATLALVAERRDAGDAQSVQLARSVLDELGPRLARVHVACTPECSVAVDHHAVSESATTSATFFVDPGARTLETRWTGRGDRTRTLECTAGRDVEVSLDAPPVVAPSVTPVVPAVTPVLVVTAPIPPNSQDPRVATDARPRRPLSPAVFWVGVGLTAVSSGLLVWSGLDTLSARDAYVAAPTQSLYQSGVASEVRSNVFVGTALGLALTTALTGILLTEWSPARRSAAMLPSVGVHDGRPTLALTRSF